MKTVFENADLSKPLRSLIEREVCLRYMLCFGKKHSFEIDETSSSNICKTGNLDYFSELFSAWKLVLVKRMSTLKWNISFGPS